MKGKEEFSVGRLGSDFEEVKGNGLEGLLRDGQNNRIVCFSVPDAELCLFKADIIEGDLADLNGSES